MSTQKLSHIRLLLLLLVVALLALDLYLSLTNPTTLVARQLGLDIFLRRVLLSVSFTGPIFLSFFFGAWSSILLLTTKFSNKKEEEGFHLFGWSILVITLVLVLGTFLGAIRNHFFFSDTYGGYKTITIVNNYVYVYGYLAGFGLLFVSVRKLLHTGMSGLKPWNIAASVFIAVLIGVFYGFMLLTNPDRATATTNLDIKPSHFIPDIYIFFTIIVPTIISWFLGIKSAFAVADIYDIPASVNRQDGLQALLYGVIGTVFSAIMLQAIISIGTTRFLASGLGFVLAILYIFVFTLCISSFLVLKGVRKITQSA